MRFRPCIDLHNGTVKQIVGSTLRDGTDRLPEINFEATESPAYYAELYRRDGLEGGHVIKLGPGNDDAAAAALRAYPGGLQIGGGITADNARGWLECGAQKVIITSYVFHEGRICWERLENLVRMIGCDNLVLDLSCRRRDGDYYIVTDRWQKFTTVTVSAESLEALARYCSEYLVHAVDIEGKQLGIDEPLICLLAAASPRPITYAGGIRDLHDLETVDRLGNGRVDATAGSSLDIFGGQGLRYDDAVAFDRARRC